MKNVNSEEIFDSFHIIGQIKIDIKISINIIKKKSFILLLIQVIASNIHDNHKITIIRRKLIILISKFKIFESYNNICTHKNSHVFYHLTNFLLSGILLDKFLIYMNS